MEKKRAPSERKAQELQALLQGQLGAESGEELLSTLVRLATERVLQEALESEQAMALGRERYERRGGENGVTGATRGKGTVGALPRNINFWPPSR